MTEECDASGKVVRKTVQLSTDQQSSIEINFDRNGVPATKVKVYEDKTNVMDKRLEEMLAVARKYNKPLF